MSHTESLAESLKKAHIPNVEIEFGPDETVDDLIYFGNVRQEFRVQVGTGEIDYYVFSSGEPLTVSYREHGIADDAPEALQLAKELCSAAPAAKTV